MVVPVAAEAEIVIDALTEGADVAGIVPLTPLLPDTTEVAPDRLVPAKVTGKVVPTVPLFGDTLDTVEAVATVVNEVR